MTSAGSVLAYARFVILHIKGERGNNCKTVVARPEFSSMCQESGTLHEGATRTVKSMDCAIFCWELEVENLWLMGDDWRRKVSVLRGNSKDITTRQ